ncbi:MAG: glycoside hydrolase family 25 protein [Chitinophagaceae bacterium]|nr:glycoside hydrolase family 25 protein [Chitinophagaceae bacterium]
MRKRTANGKYKIWKGALLVVLAAVAVSVFLINPFRLRRIRYPAFGIDIPSGYSIHGIDVSRYQKYIMWEEVKMMKVKDVRIGFVFIKATEGISYLDPYFRRNWKKAAQTGIFRGAYHFFNPSKDGKMQAENFIRHVELKRGDLPPVLDVEQLNETEVTQLRREVKRWLQTVEEYYNIKPIIYTNTDFYTRYLGNEFDEYPLWVAHYYRPEAPRISRSWLFWQHSDKGRVNGIEHPVDFNVFNGDSSDFRRILIP